MLRLFISLFSLLLLCGFTSSGDLPKDWIKSGSKPNNYETKIDQKVYKDGKSAAMIYSTSGNHNGFGTLMQNASAKEFLGKKVKMTGYIKAENVKNWTGMWLRIDDQEGETLEFDNMQDRSIKGSKDWTKCEIILNVPKTGYKMSYGVLLSGEGKVWFDQIRFEEVSSSSQSTAMQVELKAPRNLSFEE